MRRRFGETMTDKPHWRVLEDQLERLFKERDIIGRNVFDLQAAEQELGVQIVRKFKGWQILSDSFKHFYIETFRIVGLRVPRDRPYEYADFVARHSRYFLSLRAGELLFLRGYPLQGYALLRNLAEQALLRAAILVGVTNMREIEGIGEEGEKFDANKIKFRRIRAERRVFAKMLGNDSGLSDATVAELRRWDDLFDIELHGQRLSMTETMEWLKGEGGLAIFPVYVERSLAMFMNRFGEIGWMLHRLIPAMQPPGDAFPSAWVEKWNALDQSFYAFADGMSEIGKPIGTATIELVTTKFPFSTETHFPS